MNVLFMGSSNKIGLTYNLSKLAIQLRKEGDEVTVVFSHDDSMNLIELLISNSIKTIKCPTIDTISLSSIFRDALELRKIILRDGIEIIHTNGTLQFVKTHLACLWLRQKKPALVITLHSSSLYDSFIGQKAIIYSGKRADLVIPLCQDSYDFLVQHGIDRSKIRIIPNGIDLTEFDKNKMIIDHKLKTILDEITSLKKIVYVAYFRDKKGHDDLLKAAAIVLSKVNDTVFILVGDGDKKEEIIQLTLKAGLKDKVIFPGSISAQSIPYLLNNIDIGVSASLAEQFPYNLLEVMASGKPMVSTNVGSVPVILEEGLSGYIVEPGKYELLANRLLQLLQDEHHRVTLGINARKKIENHYELTVVAQLLKKEYLEAYDRCH